jgi:multidrug resistance efflux pump
MEMPSDFDLPLNMRLRLKQAEALVESAETLLGPAKAHEKCAQYCLERAAAVVTGLLQDFFYRAQADFVAKRSLDGANTALQQALTFLSKARRERYRSPVTLAKNSQWQARYHLRSAVTDLNTAWHQSFGHVSPEDDYYADPWSDWQDTGGES